PTPASGRLQQCRAPDRTDGEGRGGQHARPCRPPRSPGRPRRASALGRARNCRVQWAFKRRFPYRRKPMTGEKSMLRIKTLAFAAITLSAALLTPPALVAQAPSSLAQVSAHLKAVDTMTADFSQTDRRGQVLNGALTLKRPGKVRFQYQKGV